LGLRFHGCWPRVWRFGVIVYGLGFRDKGLGFRIGDFGFWVYDLGLGVVGLELTIWFQVQIGGVMG